MANITITFTDMNLTLLVNLILVFTMTMGGADAGRTQRRLNLLRRFHKSKMQIKEAKAAEHSPMDARMMPRSRIFEAKSVPTKSIANIRSLNLKPLDRDEKVTQLQAQIKMLFKQRKSSRNKLFYWYDHFKSLECTKNKINIKYRKTIIALKSSMLYGFHGWRTFIVKP